jgi:DNA-binding CsgD family transcriptional regulator
MAGTALLDFSSAEIASPHLEKWFAQLRAGEQVAPSTLACLAHATSRSRPPAADAVRLVERALKLTRFDEPNSIMGAAVGISLTYAGASARAAQFYDELMATARRRGSRLAIYWLLAFRSDASLRLGEIRRAEAEARSALEHGAEVGGGPGRAWTLAHLLNALVARGALEEADALAERHAPGPEAPPTMGLALFLTARANLHLAHGRPNAALRDARTTGNLVSAAISNPWACGWRSPAALALAALGREAEARATVEDELADARRFGIPDAEGAALRTLGLVAGGEAGLEALRESVAVLERGESRLEQARSSLELGAALRRGGERVEARTVLREALDATARLGASGLADRAHEELVAAGARPRRDRRLLSGRESLTASEDRVAALAAEGLTNREIAQRQFVTIKAVQWHLGNVYRKLDINSRDELPEALGLVPQDETLGRVG